MSAPVFVLGAVHENRDIEVGPQAAAHVVRLYFAAVDGQTPPRLTGEGGFSLTLTPEQATAFELGRRYRLTPE